MPGVAAHTWQAAASAGNSIGQDGMVVAAQQDFHHQLQGKTYETAIPPNQKPLIGYRDNN